MSAPSNAGMSADFVAIYKLAFSWLALQVTVDCTGLRSIYLPEYYPRMLVNLGTWIDIYAIAATTFELTVLKLDGVCLCKLLIPLKCNLKIRVQMRQKQQRWLNAMQETRADLDLESLQKIQISKQFGFKILPSKVYNSKDVYITKNSSALKMLYLQYTYILILILVNIWVKILMAFQE